MIYIQVPLEDILVVGSFWKLPRNDFIGKTCSSLLITFVEIVVFVKQIKVVHKSHEGCYNRLKTLVSVLNM